MEQVYIYVGDEYDTNAHLTTLSLFQAELVSVYKDTGKGSPPELTERKWSKLDAPVIVTKEGWIRLIPATLETLTAEGYKGTWTDPAGLLGWAIAQDFYRLIKGHCDSRGVGFGELRRAVEMYNQTTGGDRMNVYKLSKAAFDRVVDDPDLQLYEDWFMCSE